MRVFSFLNTVVYVNGVEISGWAEGDDVISIKRRNPSATDKIGAGGEMVVSISADRSGEFTFKLQGTSQSNKYLQSLQSLQQAGSSTFVPVSVLFQDTYRNDIATGTVGYITKPADVSRGANMSDSEWVIVVESLDSLIGEAADVLAGIV